MKNIMYINFKSFAIVTVVFFALIITNYVANSNLLKKSIQEQQIYAANNILSHIDLWLIKKEKSVESLKKVIEKLERKTQSAYIKEILVNTANIAHFKNFYIGYDDGVIISGLDYLQNPAYDPRQRDWYKLTLAENKTVFTFPYVDAGLNETVISICTPLKMLNAQTGVLCAVLQLDKIKNEILGTNPPYGGKVYLMNYNRKIIMHLKENKFTISEFGNLKKDDFAVLQNNVTENYILNTKEINGTDWTVVVQFEEKNVNAMAKRHFFENVLVYFIGCSIFFVLNYFFYKKEQENEENFGKIKAILTYFIENSDDGIIIENDKQKTLYYNKNFFYLLNIDETHDYTTFSPFKKLPLSIQKKIKLSIEEARERKKKMDLTFTLKRKERLHFKMEILPIESRSNTYEGLIIFYKDITLDVKKQIEKSEHQSILLQESKMADLGEMIVAISHQWKQPLNNLSLIIGNIMQLKKQNKLADEVLDINLQYSMESIHYLTNIIDTFKNFYKKDVKPKRFNIVNATQEVCDVILSHIKNTNIDISVHNNIKNNLEEECITYCNEYQQILINLINNAKDAILEDVKSQKQIDVYIKQAHNKLQILVYDFGKGINNSFKSKLFQSFQTTKENGTGKGLYISRLIARRRLNGELRVINYGKPTIFELSILKNIKGINND